VTEHYLEFDSYPKHVPRQSCRARLFRGRWHNYRCHRGNPKRLVRRLPSRRTRANRLRHLTPVRGLIFVPLQRLTLVWFSRNAANLLLGDLWPPDIRPARRIYSSSNRAQTRGKDCTTVMGGAGRGAKLSLFSALHPKKLSAERLTNRGRAGHLHRVPCRIYDRGLLFWVAELM